MPEQPLTADQFIAASGAQGIVAKLKETILKRKTDEGKDFIISDVYDSKGNQYVDLVQEGGGVWGVALLGFTYVMEEVGIRFFSIAGTSAGAINTMLLAATKSKDEAKTKAVIEKFLKLDLFSLVDGKEQNSTFTRWVKRVIQKFVLKKNYLKRIRMFFLVILLGVLLTSIGTAIAAFFTGSKLLTILAISSLVTWLVLLTIGLLLSYKIKRLIKSGYGLNAGKEFHKWITDRLAEENIHNLEDLKLHFSKSPDDLAVRRDEKRDLEHEADGKMPEAPNEPMLTIITSDLTTGNKIEFPRMWDLYWADRKDVNPADFVRASMSIPIFFETFKVTVSPKIENVADKWKDHINWTGYIPKEVQFVDGGVLSNFPINVFFNPDYIIPRMPTIGIRLSGGSGQSSSELKNVGEYVGAIVSTLRGNADKDFIIKNKAFTLGVKEVPLAGHSWLNFFMTDKEKQQIFKEGAAMAAEFLEKFDWENYKEQRLANQGILQEQRSDPNNWDD